MRHTFLKCLFLLTILSSTSCKSGVETSNTVEGIGIRSAAVAGLSSLAAAISSAGGVGGGGLFIPILTIVGGQDVKTASTYSAFMVTGGSVANVASYTLWRSGGTARRLIDYEMALLCQPWLLLGVSCGVVLNVVFPEWLIMLMFVVFVAGCTFKTCRSGAACWRLESENGCEITKMPLLCATADQAEAEAEVRTPWVPVGMLVLIWFSFFALYLIRGNRYGQGIIEIKTCGTGYWIISSMQIPLAIFFTSWILFRRSSTTASTQQENGGRTRRRPSSELVFPIMALLAGLLGGVFGIGGGMLISPILLQMGIEPQVTAATCSFMVLVSSSMSALQYLLLGMKQIYAALTYAAVCFVASLVGLTMIRKAILRHGRPSIIVFSVGTVMALSILLMTSFGAIDVWRSYTTGQNMGFKKPC
ncbi:sulfite exporter TauE/SafE family protein 2-like isoform X1 [Salvia splendens]|uniref:sulfite exporter TauE/SafE family protein 2-like isoform X1 n=1 Tax=Salvia splendens TaxID=180675 RepID=UPI001C278D9E|nr:sulfite exporter TauE/SafE family protein 2-like isoform X1 [Salvia splendens]